MSFRICIDIGGTFTDAVVLQQGGLPRIFKASSTPPAFEHGFMAALELAAQSYQLSLEDFLSRTESIVHGTTVSTNALVENKVGRAGLLVTAGHPDILLLREGPRKRTFDWSVPYPDAFIPPHLTQEIGGRIDARGREHQPLAEEDVHQAIPRFRALGVEAVAVSLLWSVVNGSHERRIREIFAAEWPEVPVTLGHELNPIQREYRRTIATAFNAALLPVVRSYVEGLETALRAAAYRRELLIANCVGGMMPARVIAEKPIFSTMSGPTLAPIAARRLLPGADLIIADMGGTTLDVSVVRDGQLIITPEALIGFDMLGVPKIDVRSIGAGGGSIAWVDPGGLLRVGPQSAGAAPGPACYGRGGILPTVTDANVVLGVIDPDNFLGGRMKLDRKAAEAAVSSIAGALGIGLHEAAWAICTTCNHNMVGAIQNITINEGIDPRESVLVSGGGATACHIAEMAEVLGIHSVLVPKLTAGLSAFGGLVSDLRFNETGTGQTSSAGFDLAKVNDLLSALRRQALAGLKEAETSVGRIDLEYAFLGRYKYQSWEIEVHFSPENGVLSEADIPALIHSFHETHERIYGVREEADIVEFTTWKVAALGRNPLNEVDLNQTGTPGDAGEAGGNTGPTGWREVWSPAHRSLRRVPVYDGNRLRPGDRIPGPGIIEESTTTLLLLPQTVAEVRPGGDYLVTTETT